MKKTLLIAVAALATGIISTTAQAQNVYSQNIVGYVNIPETAGGFNLESVPLDADGTGTNNTFASVYSNPAVGDNVYVFNISSGQYDTYSYLKKTTGHGTSAVTVTNWYDPSGNVANNDNLNPGQGVFYNAAVNETNTFVGNVLVGTWTNSNVPPANGFNLVSGQISVGGGLTTVLGYQPNIGDNVYLFNVSSGQYDTYSYLKKTTGHGTSAVTVTNWYDPSGNANEPQISVGQGFWLNPASTTSWTMTYTNN
jgi:hypothetical protein